jgi:phage shock protein PspC (stress-responsive transcriptional regulator)
MAMDMDVTLFILKAAMIFLGIACFSTALILRCMGFKLNTQNKVLTGVCAGLAQEIPCNPFWVRLGFVLTTILFGYGLGLYIFLRIVLPKHEEERVLCLRS